MKKQKSRLIYWQAKYFLVDEKDDEQEHRLQPIFLTKILEISFIDLDKSSKNL